MIENRNAVSPMAYCLAAPSSILIVVFIYKSRVVSATFIELLQISTLTYLFFFLYLMALRKWHFETNPDSKSSLLKIGLLGGLGGSLKGLLGEFLTANIVLHNFVGIKLITQSLSGFIVGFVAVAGIAYLVETVSQLSKQRHQLLDKLIAVRISELNESEIHKSLISQTSDRVAHSISQELSKHLDHIRDSNLNQTEVDTILVEIQEVNRAKIDGLKDELKTTSEQVYPKLQIRSLTKLFLKNHPFPIAATVSAIMLPSYNYIASISDLHETSLRILVSTSCLVLIFATGNRIIPLLSKFRISVWMVFIFLASLTSFFAYDAIFTRTLEKVNYGVSLIYLLWVALVAFTTGLYSSLQMEKEIIGQQLSQDIRDSELSLGAMRELNVILLKDILEFLHGRFQSQLMSSSVAINRASKIEDATSMSQEIEILQSIVNAPLGDFATPAATSFESGVQLLKRSWNNILDISISGQQAVTNSAIAVEKILKLLEEAFLNSFRHGHAASVKVEFSIDSDALLHVKVSDDGMGPRHGPLGIGSKLFDTYCETWSLVQGQDGVGSNLELVLSAGSSNSNFVLQSNEH